MNPDVFSIAPAAGRSLWLLTLVPGLALIVAATLVAFSLVGARTARFEVSSDGLRLRGDFYGRTIPRPHLRLSEVRRVDLASTPELEPVRRTMGTGLPGYRAGWFRLRNGERALVYVTDGSRGVYVPTTQGYSVLVSPANPDGLIEALQKAREPSTAR